MAVNMRQKSNNSPGKLSRGRKKKTQDIIKGLRQYGALVSTITSRGILIATIMKIAPVILTEVFADGSTFRASNSFM